MAFGPHSGNHWLKAFTHVGHNLWFRHFIFRFQYENASVAFLSSHPFLQFSLGFARTEDQNFIRRAQTRNDFIIVAGKVALIFPLP